MTPRNRKRLGLVLLVALFLTPLLAAIVLNAVGWRPAGTRNYGELVEPPRPLPQGLPPPPPRGPAPQGPPPSLFQIIENPFSPAAITLRAIHGAARGRRDARRRP